MAKDAKVWQQAADLENQSVKEYNKLRAIVENEITDFYGRPSSSRFNNLSATEMARFRKLLKEAQKLAKKLKDREFDSTVSNLLKRTKIRRDEQLLTTIEYHMTELTDRMIDEMDQLLTESAKESYKSGTELVQENGALIKDQTLTTVAINKIKNQRYPGATFDIFIKNRKGVYYKNAEQLIVRSLLADKSKTELLANFNKLTKRQKQYTKLWIRNQVSFALNLASQEAYQDAGVEKYQYNAVVDGRTTQVCLDLNGKVFKLKDGVPGVNMPPMSPPIHPCRSFITPYFGEK